MNKEQFLRDLRQALSSLPTMEVEEILRDQEEYIRDAVLAGRGEQEVLKSLGTPRSFAASLIADVKIQKAADSTTLKKQASNTFGALIAILALAPLNLIFVLGPFLGISGLIFGGWATTTAAFLGSIGVVFVILFKLIFLPVGILTHLAAIFFSLGTVGVGLLGFIFMFLVTRLFLRMTISYLRWNLHFIQTRSGTGE